MTDPQFATYPSLAGKHAFVTGGASGIGEAIVRRFAEQGAKVSFLDIADDLGKALADELGGTVGFHHADLRDVEAIRGAVAAARKEFGPVQVLANNAAHDQRHAWQDVTSDYWDERIAVNLKHVFFTIQAVAPDMVAAKAGSIINFGSLSWMIKQGGMPAYTSSKAAIHGMTRSFARDLGKLNIRVNTLVPGWVMTRRQLDLWVDEAGEKAMDEGMCLAGRVMPVDIANMAMFLAADDSRMCSAQNFVVDGGWV